MRTSEVSLYMWCSVCSAVSIVHWQHVLTYLQRSKDLTQHFFGRSGTSWPMPSASGLCRCVCLSVCLPVCLSVCLCVCLSVCPACTYVCPRYVRTCLSVSWCVCAVCLLVQISTSLSQYVCVMVYFPPH